MSVQDLEAVVDRAAADRHFRTLLTYWPEWLCSEYALSEDEIQALHASDRQALVKLGLDESRATRAALLT